jgi:hypothetical protein
LENQGAQLRARVSFSRGTVNESMKSSSGGKYCVDVPRGEFIREISRQDSNRKYWFVSDARDAR